MSLTVGKFRRPTTFQRLAAGLLLAATAYLFDLPAHADSGPTIAADIAARLSPQQLNSYRSYLAARAEFDANRELYWKLVEERRDFRRHKYAQHIPFTLDDYVLDQPPKYSGPSLPPDIQVAITAAIKARPLAPVETEKPLPSLADFLAEARANYNFVPEQTTEHEFKRRYAADALAAGLAEDQVVRVYALETGGRGTYDMQSGVDPDTKQGKPISTAMGYAQLLAANSVDELVHHGTTIIARLESSPDPHTRAKAETVKAMLARARSVPDVWSQHVQFAKTPAGQGIHAINLDSDIGPTLQVIKLKGLLETAAKEAGRTNLSGAELELMNLAGPRTGLEMMQPVGSTVPTANFFEESGYYRNAVVREKTGAQLLAAIEQRMNSGLLKSGAVDFALAFNEVANGMPSRQARVESQPRPSLGQTVFDTTQR